MVRVGGPGPQSPMLAGIARKGAEIDKIVLHYDVDKDLESMECFQGEVKLFTLTFSYDANKDLVQITRTEP